LKWDFDWLVIYLQIADDPDTIFLSWSSSVGNIPNGLLSFNLLRSASSNIGLSISTSDSVATNFTLNVLWWPIWD